MIKAVIFDLNGVFIHSEKLSNRFERDFNVPVTEFVPVLNEIMDVVRKPDAEPAFTYWEPMLRKWNISLSEDEFWNYWFVAETASEEMITLAKALKAKGVKVITLSNNFKERAEYYGHYPWMHDVMDNTYFSWQTGLAKPDVEAWKLVLSDFSLEPVECVYFDDQQKNLDAAESLGIQSFMFTTPEETRNILSTIIY